MQVSSGMTSRTTRSRLSSRLRRMRHAGAGITPVGQITVAEVLSASTWTSQALR